MLRCAGRRYLLYSSGDLIMRIGVAPFTLIPAARNVVPICDDRTATSRQAALCLTMDCADIPRATAETFNAKPWLTDIKLDVNRWKNPTWQVIQGGWYQVISFYEGLAQSGSVVVVPSLKVVLVGAVDAGKTTLTRGLLDGKLAQYPPPKTRGVDVHINPWTPNFDPPVEVVIWDFAGHDDYCSTHQVREGGHAANPLVRLRCVHPSLSLSLVLLVWLRDWRYDTTLSQVCSYLRRSHWHYTPWNIIAQSLPLPCLQLFLTSGALHMLVVDLHKFACDSSSTGDTVYVWLDSLLCRVPGSVVLVVATHADAFGDGHERSTAALSKLEAAIKEHLKEKREVRFNALV